MDLKEHNLRQLREALGPVNRWYCSEFYGYEVMDPETLIKYFIKHGGAEYFGRGRKEECRCTATK